jgi:hypothetical protein
LRKYYLYKWTFILFLVFYGTYAVFTRYKVGEREVVPFFNWSLFSRLGRPQIKDYAVAFEGSGPDAMGALSPCLITQCRAQLAESEHVRLYRYIQRAGAQWVAVNKPLDRARILALAGMANAPNERLLLLERIVNVNHVRLGDPSQYEFHVLARF